MKFNDSDDGPVGCGDFFPVWGLGYSLTRNKTTQKKRPRKTPELTGPGSDDLMVLYIWVVVSNIFYFHPYLGK